LKTKVKIGLAGAILATAFGVFAGGGVANAQIPAGLTVTKACGIPGGGTTIAQGGTAQCVIQITNTTGAAIAFAEPITVNIFGTTGTTSPVTLVNGVTGATGPDVDTVAIVNVQGANQTITVACFGATCDLLPGETITIVEGLSVATGATGTAGGPVNETIRFGAAGVVPLIPVGGAIAVAPAVATPFITTINAPVCQAGNAFVVGGPTLTTVTPGQIAGGQIVCRIDIDDNEPTAALAETVSTGLVSVNLATTGLTGVSFAAPGVGGSIDIRCGAPGVVAPNGCDFVDVVLNIPATFTFATPAALTFNIAYDPDVDTQNTSAVLNAVATGVSFVGAGNAGAPFTTVASAPVCQVGTVFAVGGTTITNVAAGQVAGNQIVCRIDLDDNEGGALGETVSTGLVTLNLLTGTTTGVTFSGAGTSITVRCPVGVAGPPAPNGCDFVDVVLTIPASFNFATPAAIGFNVAYDPDIDAQNTSFAGFTINNVLNFVGPATAGAPFQSVITLAGCQAGTTFVTGGTIANTVFPGGTITCVFDIDDNEAGTIIGGPNAGASASEFVSSGFVTVNLNAGFPAGLALVGTPGGGTITIRCPDATTTGPNVCDRVAVTFTSTAAVALTPGIAVTVSYDPDIDPQNTSTQAVFGSLFAIVQPVGTFLQPTGILFTCSAAVAGPFVGPFPGQIGTINNVVGVGILGTNPVSCTVQPTVGGVAATVAPGTFEITSINGALVDAAGRTTTNLRIACGQAALAGVTAVVTPGAPINLNSCSGVQFAVVGAGVGFVEVRARYEPATIAELAGIFSIESAVNVAFIAPAVSVNLSLSPNPVTVGQDGTATVSFGSFGTRILRDPVTNVPFVDPNTGLPIPTTGGSVLNGNVVFSIDNTAIAAFSAAQPNVATAGGALPTSAGGFVTTAAQAVVRCGFFPTTALPAVAATGTLGGFFGGCETATARYRGINPGVTNVSATFIPDLPGAFGSNASGLAQNVSGLLGLFSGANLVNPTAVRGLEVIGVAPTGNVELVRGCNNITPTVGESASAFAARVAPSGALVSIFEYQAATNTFRGFSPQAGAPNDLAAVTRLRPVFICVNAAATLTQPAA